MGSGEAHQIRDGACAKARILEQFFGLCPTHALRGTLPCHHIGLLLGESQSSNPDFTQVFQWLRSFRDS
jgi:hypothetical protein